MQRRLVKTAATTAYSGAAKDVIAQWVGSFEAASNAVDVLEKMQEGEMKKVEEAKEGSELWLVSASEQIRASVWVLGRAGGRGCGKCCEATGIMRLPSYGSYGSVRSHLPSCLQSCHFCFRRSNFVPSPQCPSGRHRF